MTIVHSVIFFLLHLDTWQFDWQVCQHSEQFAVVLPVIPGTELDHTHRMVYFVVEPTHEVNASVLMSKILVLLLLYIYIISRYVYLFIAHVQILNAACYPNLLSRTKNPLKLTYSNFWFQKTNMPEANAEASKCRVQNQMLYSSFIFRPWNKWVS